MNQELTTVEKIRRLPWSIGAWAANAVFVQLTFFGSVFILFLSELGLSKTEIGFLLSLLPFFGLIALFIAPAVARFGYKRTHLVFFTGRKIITAFLLFTPWVMSQFGPRFTLAYVIGIVAFFALCRSISMTAIYPWSQEYVPGSVRGKYSALNNIFSSLSGFLAVVGAGYVVGHSTGLGRFTVLIGVGVLFGMVSIWAFLFVPGGAPKDKTQAAKTSRRDLKATLKDKRFLRYMAGAGMITLAATPLTSFLPLFMQEQVGLSAGNVVLLQNGTLLGGLLTSYTWGWAADRYGSKPVMLSGVSLTALLPACWLLMPRQTGLSLYLALGIAFLQGVANMSWVIGADRMLFVSVVPTRKKDSYMPLYYAWMGVAGGLSQLAGGWILDASAGLDGQFLILKLDQYTPLLISSLVLPLLSGALLQSIRAESQVSLGEFAGMFLRGNPLLAMESLIGYRLAKDERATVSVTERLGQTQSPLTVEELLKALSDPRFYVRFEAIVSIARRGPDERLLDALIDVLGGHEPALSVIAAWALGRIGDERACPALHAGLESRYRSVQAHCARSLGSLEDETALPLLLERLSSETDCGLRIAYASALGKLGAQQSIGEILPLLRASQDVSTRMELGLALARLVGDEHYFVQLLRQADVETGTLLSQAVTALTKKLRQLYPEQEDSELINLMEDCANALARQQLDRGIALLGCVIGLLPLAELEASRRAILLECAERIDELGTQRIEYVILTLHTMNSIETI